MHMARLIWVEWDINNKHPDNVKAPLQLKRGFYVIKMYNLKERTYRIVL